MKKMSPLPWFVGHNTNDRGIRTTLICSEKLQFENKVIAKVLDWNMASGVTCYLPGDENAAFIVRAVNDHHRLVDFLRAYFEMHPTLFAEDVCDQIRALIKEEE